LGELCEFADADGNVIENIVLYAPSIFNDTNTDKDNPTETLTGINSSKPDETSGIFLGNNIPNPFNDKTDIRYSIPFDGKVKLSVFDIYGQEIECLVDEYQQPGNYIKTFDAKTLQPGIYFYRICIDGKHFGTNKMILNK
jgi:hypothetical protein